MSQLHVVDRVRAKLKEKEEESNGEKRTTKSLERSLAVARKSRDNEMLLTCYYELALHHELLGEANPVQTYLESAMELIEQLRGGKEKVTLEDSAPLVRIWEQRGRMDKVKQHWQSIYSAMEKAYGYNDIRLLPVAERMLEASLRTGNADSANIEQQVVQRIRESHTPAEMLWPHPPLGEKRHVKNIKHLKTNVELARYFLIRRSYKDAMNQLQVVLDWREELRQMGKDWRRRDAHLLDRIESMELVAQAVFHQGEAFAAMNRTTTAERRMLEGLAHWEELMELETSSGIPATCSHRELLSLHTHEVGSTYKVYITWLLKLGRNVEALEALGKCISHLQRPPLRAFSPQYSRAIRDRAQIQLECNHISEGLEDLMEYGELSSKIYGAKSTQVALSYCEQARSINFVTNPTQQEWDAALLLAQQGLKMLEQLVGLDSPQLVPALRVYGCLLVRLGRMQEAILLLERYDRITERFPGSEKRIADRVFTLESLAEAYTNIEPKETSKASKALEACIKLMLHLEMEGRPDVTSMSRLKVSLDKVRSRFSLPVEARYLHPRLRFCCNQKCGRQETRPDQYHRTKSRGVLRFCSDECLAEFNKYSASNNWLGLDSACPAGPLTDLLLLRCLMFLHERPYWFRLAMVSSRLWNLVSHHRSSIRFPEMVKRLPLDPRRGSPMEPSTIASLLGRSPRLLHLDFSDCTVVDDKVCFHIGEACPELLTLSLRGSSHVTDIGVEDLANCKKLERLDLSFCEFVTDEGVLSIARSLGRLELLSLSHCHEISEEGIIAIAKGQLVYLDISYCKRITDRGLKAILRFCSSLRHLDLRGVNNLTTAELRRVDRQVETVLGLPWKEPVAADLLSTVETPRFRME
ncbi:hypothetical protein GUITHDRAFT_138435 [Guillardia theta CCMP2712]|uniref:F-box/LRR-repeat protein 15-like leucin rich repeat domain-containing protein n=1 Tax=Guillardia theta (strain CCMP2712) TaxID=905079 RepID=L1JDK0_GUITC|nr:hypothetical protein GUITHDRAFT_138435 [Guillardia theta CCMP2712]EKX46362.1 hypothetical protein GUITHDRAFT_138435 [Guillardia theta CCMP2712]|eukprot:XP_005833342.1 hypothetical protein GUITHDRAFT_138435 [Guillardia theta CCMP2712]